MQEKIFYSFFLPLFFRITCTAEVFDFDTKWYYCQQRFSTDMERCSMAELQYSTTSNDTLYGVFLDDSHHYEVKQLGKKLWFDGLKIYDFDLMVGDSVTVKNYNGPAEKHMIDSIQSKFIYGKTRTLQFTSDFIVIEGIGTALLNDPSRFYFDQVELSIIADPARMLKYVEFDDQLEKIENVDCSACEELVTNLHVVNQTDLIIYPNPVSDRLYLNDVNAQQIAIYNNSGQKVVNQKHIDKNGIDVSRLATGIYFLVLDGKKKTRFVKE